jgi:hypothetical protein
MSYRVLLSGTFSGSIDGWTEYLCMEILPDGRVELTSRSREPLATADWTAGAVVYPDGVDPDDDTEGEVLPLTIAGKPVWGRDGDFLVGEDMLPHSDDATAIFEGGESTSARDWLEAYGWSRKPGFAEAWSAIAASIADQASRRGERGRTRPL